MGAIIEINKRITMFMKIDKHWENAKPVVKFGVKKLAMHSFCIREITELRAVKQQIIRMMLLLCIVLSTSCAVQKKPDLFKPTNAIYVTWKRDGYYIIRIGEDMQADSIKCEVLERMVELKYPGQGKIICAKDIFHFDFFYGVK